MTIPDASLLPLSTFNSPHAIFSDSIKEIFLHELISNGSDALNKICYSSLTDLKTEPKLYIHITPDKANKCLLIHNPSLGMTKAFMEALLSGADISMICRFGAGLHSAYLVAERAQVIAKHNDDEQYIKESTASGTFMIMRDTVNPPQGRSSKTCLYLKEGQLKYLKKVCSFQINSEYILTCMFNFIGSSG
jgi:molecular chaperone HtpG